MIHRLLSEPVISRVANVLGDSGAAISIRALYGTQDHHFPRVLIQPVLTQICLGQSDQATLILDAFTSILILPFSKSTTWSLFKLFFL